MTKTLLKDKLEARKAMVNSMWFYLLRNSILLRQRREIFMGIDKDYVPGNNSKYMPPVQNFTHSKLLSYASELRL